MIYTTYCIESLNKKNRRTKKIRGSFSNEDSTMNLIVTAQITPSAPRKALDVLWGREKIKL
jgi:transposase-like protein